jgi:hypothetical protein
MILRYYERMYSSDGYDTAPLINWLRSSPVPRLVFTLALKMERADKSCPGPSISSHAIRCRNLRAGF